MQQACTPSVPFFQLMIARSGVSNTLQVPYTLGAGARRSRLDAFLAKEHWSVVSSNGAAAMLGGLGGFTDRQVQAEELRFVRDCLGPLRIRPGPVPEKVAGKMLEVGVKELHKRTLALFGQPWADFLLDRWPVAHLPPAQLVEPTFVPGAAAPVAPIRAAQTPAASAAAVATVPSIPAPLPAALLPAASEAATLTVEESLVEMLLGEGAAACGPFDSTCDEIESILTGAGFQLDMAAAVEVETSWVPPTPPSASLLGAPTPAPSALLNAITHPTASTATSPAAAAPGLREYVGQGQGQYAPSPVAYLFLEQLDLELADPLLFPTGPPPGVAVDDPAALLAPDIPDMPPWPASF